MENNDSLKKVVQGLNKGKAYPAMKLVQNNPETAAMISKLITPKTRGDFDIQKKNAENSLNRSQLQAISDSTKSRILDNEDITNVFPDIELAIQVLISSILSPKDMVKTDLIYKSKEPFLPSELLLKLSEVVKSHIEGHYGVVGDLQEILRDTLFNTGSYIKAVIPESVVDEVINHNEVISTESLVDIFDGKTMEGKDKIRTLGILGGPGKRETTTISALESFLSTSGPTVAIESRLMMTDDKGTAFGTHVEVTDNIQLLKLPKVVERAVKQNIQRKIHNGKVAAMEAFGGDKKITAKDLRQLSYKDQRTTSRTFVVLTDGKNGKRKSIGRPLVLRLPSEAVIPVYIPGDEKKHIGYFVLVDVDGNPVSRNSTDTSQEAMSGLAGLSQRNGNPTGQGQSMSSYLLSKAKANLANQDSAPTIDHMTQVYTSIVENNLMERLSNGIYGNNVKISNNEEVYRIMLSRSLASKFTRLIYIPSELTTYFAFNHYPNGVGKSYLDSVKNLTSLRAILLFSKVMAQVKSAISLTHVGMTLDPNDPDPQKTIEIAQHEVLKMRQQYFPLGINSSADLVNWIQRAGLEFSFEGHPGLPQTKFDFETKNLQREVPDNELDELLRKQTYMAFGLTPEVVDEGFNAEFATTVVANNILLSKRVVQLQSIFTPQLSDYIRKVIGNDQYALEELSDVLKENKGLIEKSLTDEEKAEYDANNDLFIRNVIERFLENMQVDLPQPDITALASQSEAFNQYEEALEKALDSWISTSFMTSDLAGDINTNIDSIKAVLKAHFLRRWMADNGYMAELNDIVTADEDGKPTIDIFDMNRNHMDGLIRSCAKFLESLQPMVQAGNKDLQTLGIQEGDSSSSSSSDSGSDDFGGGDDGFGDLGGGDDGMGDLGGDDTPPPEDTTGTDDTKTDDAPPADA